MMPSSTTTAAARRRPRPALPDDLQWLDIDRIARTSGTAVLVSERGTPDLGLFYLYLGLKQSLPEKMLLMSLDWQEQAHVVLQEQVTVTAWGQGIAWVHMRLGFADTPQLHFHLLAEPAIGLSATGLRYYLRADGGLDALRRLPWWRRKLFGWMRRFDHPAAEVWGLPSDKVVLLHGLQPGRHLPGAQPSSLDGVVNGSAVFR